MKKLVCLAAALVLVTIPGCRKKVNEAVTRPAITITADLNPGSETYVKLVLALGEHDADYVDAYYGPPAWREEVRAAKRPVKDILADATKLRDEIGAMPKLTDAMDELRREYLRKQTESLIARAEMLEGKKFSFDEEARALYDAVVPTHSEEYFEHLNAELEKELPGKGSLTDRLEAFRKDFIIPHDKLDAVFMKAIEGCRARTMNHAKLPEGEKFTVEYVTNKSWSGYNWYKGSFTSLIQVNTDLPIYIDRAIDLACHEGYPGHHVYNAMLEKSMVKDRGWQEFTVYPLFSPQSLIAEGSANYGIDIAFPAGERVAWEKENLFPLAGLDPVKADQYYRVQELTARTSYAANEAARRLLNGEINDDQAAEWMSKYALMTLPRAKQRVKFIRQYGAYVINYNLGKDLVRAYVERHAGNDRAKRWTVFMELLSSPRLPSGLER